MIDLTTIAQAEFGDWVETIIVLVVVLGGVFQGVGKAIVKKIAAKKEADASEPGKVSAPPQAPQQGRRLAPRTPDGRPVARPVAARPDTAARRHPSQMQAPRPVAPPVLGSPQPRRRPTGSRPDPARPIAKPLASPSRSRRPQPSGSVGLQQRKPRELPARRSEREQPSEEKHEALAEHHLQLSDEVAHPSTAAEHLERSGGRIKIPPLTRSALRDAVLLREILGPPIALRNSIDDR